MSIVIITIPGEAQKAFVNALHRETNGAVALVVIQSPKRLSLFARARRFYKRVGFRGLFVEFWYAALLRLNPRVRKALAYFQVPHGATSEEYIPRVMWAESVNDDAVHEALDSLSPDVLAVWGSAILKPHIIATAKIAVNVHFGHSPQYRGALANQHAVLNDDLAHVGATIHHIHREVDAGDILERITIDLSQPPSTAFPALTTRARQRFIEIVTMLHAGEILPVRTQDKKHGDILLLRHWLPSTRFVVGSRVLALEKAHTDQEKPVYVSTRLALLGITAAVLSLGGYALASGISNEKGGKICFSDTKIDSAVHGGTATT